jgi:hypothetical protein
LSASGGFVFRFNRLAEHKFKTKRSAQKTSFDASRFGFEPNSDLIGIVEAKTR